MKKKIIITLILIASSLALIIITNNNNSKIYSDWSNNVNDVKYEDWTNDIVKEVSNYVLKNAMILSTLDKKNVKREHIQNLLDPKYIKCKKDFYIAGSGGEGLIEHFTEGGTNQPAIYPNHDFVTTLCEGYNFRLAYQTKNNNNVNDNTQKTIIIRMTAVVPKYKTKNSEEAIIQCQYHVLGGKISINNKPCKYTNSSDVFDDEDGFNYYIEQAFLYVFYKVVYLLS
jgi:hypothetical protein